MKHKFRPVLIIVLVLLSLGCALTTSPVGGVFYNTKDGINEANFQVLNGNITGTPDFSPEDAEFCEEYGNGEIKLCMTNDLSLNHLYYTTGNESVNFIAMQRDSVAYHIKVERYDNRLNSNRPVETWIYPLESTIQVNTSLGPTIVVWYRGGFEVDVIE